jgi:hypothetical protein
MAPGSRWQARTFGNMNARKFSLVVALVITVALAGVAWLVTVSQEKTLTPERAKDALMEMIRSKEGKNLGWFEGDVPEEMAKFNIKEYKDGWYAWTGAFLFHPSKAIYTFVVRPRPYARACVFEYKGSFVIKDGRWAATPPELVSTALQKGE